MYDFYTYKSLSTKLYRTEYLILKYNFTKYNCKNDIFHNGSLTVLV